MATPSEKLAESLAVLQSLQDAGVIAIRAADLSRTHKQRLLANGFIQEVLRGWYIPSRPDEPGGESTAWYASFWDFCAAYLTSRFDMDWSLSPEQSLAIHAGSRTVPRQLLVRTPRGNNNVTGLPFEISLLDVRSELPDAEDIESIDGLRVYAPAMALIACSPQYFRQQPAEARAVLSMIRTASEVLERLLEGGHSVIAGRLAGAFRNIGRERIAEEIVKTMRAAGYDVRETDPFASASPVLITARETSPHVNRLHLQWAEMREVVLAHFPKAPGLPRSPGGYLKNVDEIYVTDAYHSLSIEGYRVSPELIERVRSGQWNPDDDEYDREHLNALAARGYWQAFTAVKESLEKVLRGSNAGEVAEADHGEWYRQMFAPNVAGGLLRAGDLAGYRNSQVFIRRSMHIPPHKSLVRDLMPEFFHLLSEEENAAVRVGLGHFFFVYIHPYMDGNGRMGRFLMNLMLASGGYSWTVIPVEERDTYMQALEEASVGQDIGKLAGLLARLVQG